ncbi:metal tolerance protein 10 [Quercus suber]|uniref:Metal tolerance protein 10 n=1 Tax=Quercus suber TaxID=58331 RepID=A0AAW0LIX6_QUESU
MEDGGNGTNVSHESRRENFVPQDVESASRSEMSSGSWRLSVHEFPALAEKRDREHKGGNGMNVSHESRRENFGPQDVESAARSEMSSGSWRLSVHEFPALPERRDREHGFFTLRTLLHAPRKRSKVADYYKKQERLLEVFTEMETMAENAACEEREGMAIYISNIANIVLFVAKLYVSIQSRSLAVIASTLDSLLDLLSGFILWFTAHAMRNPNLYSYPIGKNRMQPVTQPEKDPEKEKWMIGIMVSVTIVKFLLVVYCRRFKNQIIRAYGQDHCFDVITNSIGLGAAVLAIQYYWWIDPTGAVIIALYTMNIWTKTVIENVWALIGRTAPPEFLAKLTYLTWNHHEDIKHIDTVRAYTFGSNYFVEVDIVLPQDMLLNKAHNIGESLRVKLEQLPEIERAFVHIDFEYTHRPEHKIAI